VARFNEILTGRFNRALQKVTGIKGAASTPVLASEIVPSFPMFWGAENRYLESWNRFAIFQTVAALAANLSLCILRNPPGSNVVAVIEKILVSNANGTAQEHKIFLEYTASGGDLTPVAARILDPRGGQNTASTCIFSAGNTAAAAGTAILDAFVPASTSFDFLNNDLQEITLLPTGPSGTRLIIGPASTNLIAAVTLIWRERVLEESERT
jgi:hypothetical protein